MTLRSLPVCCCRSLLPKYDLSCHFQLPTSSNAAPHLPPSSLTVFLLLSPFPHSLRSSPLSPPFPYSPRYSPLSPLYLPLLPLSSIPSPSSPPSPFHPLLHLLPLPSSIFTFFTYFPSSPTPCLSPKQALHGAASLPAAVAHLQPKYNLACHF